MLKNRYLRIGLRAGAVLLAACLGWAFLWPDNTCADPVCAKSRFALFIELDALERAGDVPLVIERDGETVSVQSILAAAGVDVTIERDQVDLPYDPASGPLDRADLFQLFATWNGLPKPPGVDAKIYAILTTALVADTGEDLFGIMFDYAGREGFAVAPAATRARFEMRHPELIPPLQLRTFTHELLHALNRHHLDAAQTPDGLLTLEAPTKCIADTRGADWSLREPLSWDVSPATIRFFQSAPEEYVLPGARNRPFEFAPVSPRECEEARSRLVQTPAESRWGLARNRLQRLFSLNVAQAAPVSEPVLSAEIDLQVQAQSAPYPLGYPVAVRIIAVNRSDRALPLVGRLAPTFGLVQIETRRIDGGDADDDADDEWRVFHPITRFEPVSDHEAMLAPGTRTEQTGAVYFGEDGWTFAEPGTYELRARFAFGDMRDEVTSPPITVRVYAPEAPREVEALERLLDDDGNLDLELGRLLAFGGRIGGKGTLDPIEALVADYGDTPLGAAARLAVASHRLRPPLDVTTGRRPPRDVEGAQRLLADTCIDSGVAALKRELLVRHQPELGEMALEAAQRPVWVAWDGLGRKVDDHIETYADPTLTRAGPSLHFCAGSTWLRSRPRTAGRELARSLLAREQQPERIVIVGHTDAPASCGYNDQVGLERAAALRDLFVAEGIDRGRIEIASLGERRPMSFSTTRSSRALNRRVEVLVSEVARRGPEMWPLDGAADEDAARDEEEGVGDEGDAAPTRGVSAQPEPSPVLPASCAPPAEYWYIPDEGWFILDPDHDAQPE